MRLGLSCVCLFSALQLGFGCAQAVIEGENQDLDASVTTGSSSGNAGGSNTTAGGGGSGSSMEASTGTGMDFPCGIDCSTIMVGDCQVAECNLENKQCEIVPATDGAACEDGLFCTVNDSCVAGECVGGEANDCGMPPPECTSISCDETSMSCSTVPAAEGSACQSTALCEVNSTCQAGKCVGIEKDCFFAPVPSDCHIAKCNPQNGQCEPEPGNDGQLCSDLTALCTVGKTCNMGKCEGGMPKDCSALTQGCNIGECDATTGSCVGKPVMPGQMCDDLNSCTTGETCSNGVCGNGTPITQCVANDSCCPPGCTEMNDADCSCSVNLATMAVGSSSGGGSGTYGPPAWNDGKNEAGCVSSGCSACFGWINNSTSPSGKWAQYEWTSAQQIGSIFVDANACKSGCYNGGRTLHTGKVQYFSGGQWVTAGTFTNTSNDGNIQFNFSPKVTTTKIRLFDIAAESGCGQDSNTLIYEWYVYPGANCQPAP